MRTINEIIIHCSATREDCDFTAEDIDLWHRQQGYDCIGYHFVIRLNGTLEIGRPIDKVGAHVKGHNQNSIGIVYIGGVDANGSFRDTRTPEQRGMMMFLIKTLLACFSTIKKVSGHCEYANKACPCFDVHSEYDKLFVK